MRWNLVGGDACVDAGERHVDNFLCGLRQHFRLHDDDPAVTDVEPAQVVVHAVEDFPSVLNGRLSGRLQFVVSFRQACMNRFGGCFILGTFAFLEDVHGWKDAWRGGAGA